MARSSGIARRLLGPRQPPGGRRHSSARIPTIHQAGQVKTRERQDVSKLSYSKIYDERVGGGHQADRAPDSAHRSCGPVGAALDKGHGLRGLDDRLHATAGRLRALATRLRGD
jgi:hypothetical protein